MRNLCAQKEDSIVRLRPFLAAGMTAAMSFLVMSPVRANENEVTVSFFHSANAEARWVHFTPAPAGDPDTWSIKLRLGPVPSTCPPPNYVNCPYAGVRLHGVEGPAPANAPSFDYYSTVAGSSGGSPRLHMDFSDGGSIELRPVTLVQNTWIREGPASTGSPTSDPTFAINWDNNGGTCGFLYGTTYAIAVACHSSATVTGVIVVTDSAWLYPPAGYTHYIDNISYGNAFITSPEEAGCHEGDGNGHFRGNNGDGNFESDSDGCRDGDEDHVHSDNRGDGKDFNSTRIDSVALNSLGNTLTITGIGTSAGAPVSFVLVEVESTLLTPGSVSLSFSDGFTNVGDLLDGSILLH
jgi:hypothetical protein